MKIYVYAEAYTPTEDYAEIMETRVFTDKKDAVDHLYYRSEGYKNHPEDGEKWHLTYEDSYYCHMIYNKTEDEVVMTITEHEI